MDLEGIILSKVLSHDRLMNYNRKKSSLSIKKPGRCHLNHAPPRKMQGEEHSIISVTFLPKMLVLNL